MKKVTETNQMEKCSDLDTFNFEPWRETKKQAMTNVKVENEASQVRSIKN